MSDGWCFYWFLAGIASIALIGAALWLGGPHAVAALFQWWGS